MIKKNHHEFTSCSIATALALLALTFGCSSSGDDDKQGPSTDGTQTVRSSASGDFRDLEQSLMIDGGYAYLAYLYPPDASLRFARSDDAGATWPGAVDTEVLKPSPGSKTGRFPRIAADGSTLYICFVDEAGPSVKVAKSTDRGQTWPQVVTVVTDLADELTWGRGCVDIAVNGSSVCVAYWDGRGSAGYCLKSIRSSDGGATWPTDTIVTVDGGWYAGTGVSMESDGPDLFLAYCITASTDYRLRLAKSTDGGATWPAAASAEIDSAGGDVTSLGQCPSLSREGNVFYVSYGVAMTQDDDNKLALRLAASNDGGSTWPASGKATFAVDENLQQSSLATMPGKAYVPYFGYSYSETDGAQYTLKMASLSGDATGLSLTGTSTLYDAGYSGIWPVIAIDSGEALVISADVSDYRIFALRKAVP